jgi:hypothetical protein
VLPVAADAELLQFPPSLERVFPYLCMERERPVKLGESVTAIGFRLGYDTSIKPGNVTSFSGPSPGLVQTNLGLAKGMSGGPVLNSNGFVVGVIAGGLAGVSNFDYFTPVNLISTLFSVVVPRPDCIVHPSPSVSNWEHNDSSLELVFGPEVGRVRFIFTKPRPGLTVLGVKKGWVQFDGMQDGNSYRGKGFAFSKYCGALQFDMAGDGDKGAITLKGRQPLVDPTTCVRSTPTDVEWKFQKK